MVAHFFVVVTGFLLCLACFTVPGSKRTAINFMPDSRMNSLGATAYDDILSKEKVSTNSRLVNVVRKVGKRIALASGAKFSWEFNVIDSDKVNAFCLPGGKVAIYTGILSVAQTEGGLAAVMGHEVAHAVARHGGERMSQGVLSQVGMAASALTFRNSKHANLIMGALGAGIQFGVILPFSRSHETEADVLGTEYMAKAGYDPREAGQFWARMGAKGSRVPEFMSTHPDPANRSKKLKSLAASKKIQNYYRRSSMQLSRKLPI